MKGVVNVGLAAFVVLAVASLAVLAAVWGHYSTKAALAEKALADERKAFAKLHQDLTTCQSERTALRASMDELGKQLLRQSAALEEVKRERDDGRAKWKHAERMAELERQVASKRIEALMSRVAPEEAKQCAALDELRRGYLAGQIR